MSKVMMPEPVAWRNLGSWPRISWLTHGRDSEVEAEPLITTEQAEAYAAAKVRESLTWQPIEIAPRDGTQIIGRRGDELHICSWEALDNPVAQHWGIEGTWHRRDVLSGKSLMGGNFAPTHWMPLPPPPVQP